MDELAMSADKQWTVYPEEVTCQLHVMAHGRESSLVIDRRSKHCATKDSTSYWTQHTQAVNIKPTISITEHKILQQLKTSN